MMLSRVPVEKDSHEHWHISKHTGIAEPRVDMVPTALVSFATRMTKTGDQKTRSCMTKAHCLVCHHGVDAHPFERSEVPVFREIPHPAVISQTQRCFSAT